MKWIAPIALILFGSQAQAVTPPGGVLPCMQAYHFHIPCYPFMPYMSQQEVQKRTNLSFAGSPGIGTTPAQMTANFPAQMLWVFQHNPQINAQITRLPDMWVGHLSHDLYVYSHGNVQPFLNQAAKVLDAANLQRLKRSFGQQHVDAAVNVYSSQTIKTQYFTTSTKPFIHQSQAHYASMGLNAYQINGFGPAPNPAISTALNDAFLEFYCYGEGTTFFEAFVMMSNWAAGPLGLAAMFGSTAGTVIYHIGDSISPGIWADVIEFYGAPFFGDHLPVGSVTVGEPFDNNAPTQTVGDFEFYCDNANPC